ncbi:CHAD domain-containing protein [Streptomyces sp. NPDC057621]|uniref:CYTH and CHAD domain-containing protein n=1 Tax=Streptomyces sp. NPDC057621 TaxID=3346186 RepID=UPI003690877E
MVQSMRETERKYEVPSPADTSWLPELERVDGVAAVVDRSPEELDAVYYDTDDLRLSGSSAVLRRRTGGTDAGWHLKLPLSGDSREEIRSALTDTVPEALLDLTRSRTRGAELTPVVRIRSTREVRHLVDADGTTRAELCVDSVRAQSLRADGRHAAWNELEVELAEDADPALLDAVEKKLRKKGIARAHSPSKLVRALDETVTTRAGAPGGSVGPDPGQAGAQVLAYLRKQIRALTELDPAVRRDRPDSVHRMRVACRRLRSCLRSYRSVLDREATDSVRGELKWLAGELGAERDQEVLMERLSGEIAALPEELVLGPVDARLRVWNVVDSTESHLRSLDALGSRRYLDLLDSLAVLLEHPPLRAKAARAAEDAEKVMAKAVLKEYGRLATRMTDALELSPGPERDVALHEARKAAKKVRYATEVARPALGKPARSLGKRVKAVQKVLGDHQDSVVARGALRDLAVAAQTAGEAGFTWGLLYGTEQARAENRERELPSVWELASDPGAREKLGR